MYVKISQVLDQVCIDWIILSPSNICLSIGWTYQMGISNHSRLNNEMKDLKNTFLLWCVLMQLNIHHLFVGLQSKLDSVFVIFSFEKLILSHIMFRMIDWLSKNTLLSLLNILQLISNIDHFWIESINQYLLKYNHIWNQEPLCRCCNDLWTKTLFI